MSKASERVKLWRKANPEKYRAQKRAWYKKHADAEKARNVKYKRSEAGKLARSLSRAKSRARENALSGAARKRRHRLDPRKGMLFSAKRRAKIKSIEFRLTVSDIVVPKLCPLLRIPLLVNDQVLSANSPTLDRLRNNVGYVPGNVIVVSYAANRCKGNLSSDDIFTLVTNLKMLEALYAAQ